MSISRKTKQKKTIDMSINSFDSFFSIEDLNLNINKIDPNLGVATIYRHLKNFRENNKISYFLCDGKNIYSKNKTVHSHFKCEICNELSHFEINSIDFLKNKIEGKIKDVSININGICKKCLKDN